MLGLVRVVVSWAQVAKILGLALLDIPSALAANVLGLERVKLSWAPIAKKLGLGPNLFCGNRGIGSKIGSKVAFAVP